MTATFLLCMGALALILYLPGYFILRSLRLEPISALMLAPIPSIAFYAGIPIIFGLLGIPCTWASVTIPNLIICLACWIGGRLWAHNKADALTPSVNTKHDWAIMVLYLAVGIALCGLVFITSMNGLDSYDAKYDNMTHYNNVRSFVESGIWSSLATSSYHGTGLDTAPMQSTAFYPSAWHSLVSIIISMLGCDVAIAVNAINIVIMGIVFPLSMYAFLRKLFASEPLTWIVGAFTTLAFVAFPWALLIKGPLYSNILAYAILPGVLSAFVGSLGHGGTPKAIKVLRYSVIGALSFIALGLSQPNSLFVLLLFFIFYAAPLLKERLQRCSKMSHRLNPILYYTVYAVCATLIWIGLTNLPLPLFEAVIHFENPGDINLTPIESIFNTLSFSFVLSPPQWLLVIAAFVGGLYLIACNRGRLTWLSLYMLFAYCISRFMTGFPKILITGIWYNDSWRLGACAALFLMPLVTSGLALAINTLSSCLVKASTRASGMEWHPENGSANKRMVCACTVAVMMAFSIINYFPNYAVVGYSNTYHHTPFGYVRQRIAKSYGTTVEQSYSREERDFVQRALEIVPEDAVIINQPNDGSVFAYGLDGLNTYYRSIYLEDFNEDATNIRTGLDRIDDDDNMKNIIDSMGETYVILLDQGRTIEEGVFLREYVEKTIESWDGINGITDDTPGIELVLAEDDMRLYKIN